MKLRGTKFGSDTVNKLDTIVDTWQWSAFISSVSLLVPKEQLGRYGGMNQSASALSMLFAPGIAGALLSYIQLKGIFILELLTFLFAATITLSTSIPRPPKSEEGQVLLSTYLKTCPWLFLYITRACCDYVALLFIELKSVIALLQYIWYGIITKVKNNFRSGNLLISV
jgi:DHA3 family macrolide efflux protein-like MFS transporter